MASRKGSDSMSPTVPPISTITTSAPSATLRKADLISSVTCGITCTVLAEIIAAALLGNDGFVDAAGGPVVVAGQLGIGEALVVAQVEVGLGAVIGDVDFAVLVRTHGAGIDVQVGIALLEGDAETTTFQQAADRGGGYPFSQGGNNTASNKDKLRAHPRNVWRDAGTAAHHFSFSRRQLTSAFYGQG